MNPCAAKSDSTSAALWHERFPGRREQNSRRGDGPSSSGATGQAGADLGVRRRDRRVHVGRHPEQRRRPDERVDRRGLVGDHDAVGVDATGGEQVQLPRRQAGARLGEHQRPEVRMPFEGRPPAPEVTDLVGEGVPEVAADIAVQQVRRPFQARGRRRGLADEARRPLGERHVAQPPLERVPVALRQHEPGAVRRLAAEAGHVVVLAHRHRRGVDLGGQLDRCTRPQHAARREVQGRDRGQGPAGLRPCPQEGVGVRLGHLGEGADRVGCDQPTVVDRQVRRPRRPARRGPGRGCRAGRGRASAAPRPLPGPRGPAPRTP